MQRVLEQPADSPDLITSDYHLFGVNLKIAKATIDFSLRNLKYKNLI